MVSLGISSKVVENSTNPLVLTLFTELRSLIADIGKNGGLISPSVYDTAQVLRFGGASAKCGIANQVMPTPRSDRIIAPLRPAKDAIILSTDGLTVAEVMEKVVKSYYQKTQALIL